MFTLKTLKAGSQGQATAAKGDHGLILPRVLRRPARILGRLMDGHLRIPKHTETIGIIGIFAATALYGSILGGQFSTAVERVTAATGLAVSEIEINGHVHTPPQDVFAVLGLDRTRSLVSIDPGAARGQLATLPWVQSSEIRKVYPGKLIISLTERVPFAIWQTGEALSVVEADGAVIGGYSGDTLRHLPLLVGSGAAAEGRAFMEEVATYPTISDRVHAYVRVGERRWNLRLANGITIKLPEQDVDKAFERLVLLQHQLGVFERDVATIDVRFDGRTVFGLTEDALAKREASLKAQGIEADQQGSSI